MQKQILVSGYNGFVGSALVKHFTDLGVTVLPLHWNIDLNCYDLADQIKFDVETYIFHLGAHSKRNAEFLQAYQKNIYPFKSLYNLCNKFEDIKLIYASSAACTPNLSKEIIGEYNSQVNFPKDIYSISKLVGEFILDSFFEKKNYCILRIPGIYSSNRYGGFISRLAQDAFTSQKICILNSNSITNAAIDISTLCKFLVRLIEDGLFEKIRGKKMYLGATEAITFGEIANYIVEKSRSKSEIYLDNSQAPENYILDISLAKRLGLDSFSMIDVVDAVIKLRT
jgi:nucleoside-diphosphate-sugar epimerase